MAKNGAMTGISKEKLYNELGKGRWHRKLGWFLKIFRYQCPEYQFNIIPTSVSIHNTRNTNNISLFKVKHKFFQNSFFSSVVIEWNKLDQNISNSESLIIFKKTLLKFMRPPGSNIFNCHNSKGVKLLTRLRLG